MKHEIYLDKERTKPFTDYEVDESGYAILKNGTFFIFGNSKVRVKSNGIAWTFDKVEVIAYQDSRVIPHGQSEVYFRENAIIHCRPVAQEEFMVKASGQFSTAFAARLPVFTANHEVDESGYPSGHINFNGNPLTLTKISQRYSENDKNN
jgi:hypothetical protein